jgi:DHA2 family methylenomycin A resistance protein-like MFS transporter
LPLGPLLGGVLTTSGSWRLIFWINVPVLLVAALVSLRVVPDLRPAAPQERFDVAGVVGFAVGLGSLVFAVIEFGRDDRVLGVVAALFAAVALAAVLVMERRAARPVLPVDLLRQRSFLAPNVVAFTMNSIFNGTLFVVTLYLQDVRGLSALTAGLLVLPLAVPLVALAPLSGRLTARRGPRTAVAGGCLVAVAGPPWLFGLSADGSLGWLVVGLGLLGCGAGLITASVVAAVVRATPPDRAGLATGVSNTARQVGTAVGVAVFGAVAGSPARVQAFLSGAHRLFALAIVLWVVALMVALTGVEDGGRVLDSAA